MHTARSRPPAALARRLAVLAALSAPAAADTITLHVDDDAPPGGDGMSWQSAFSDLQDALDLARTIEACHIDIKVAGGVYTPDRGTGDRTSSFLLEPPQVSLEGQTCNSAITLSLRGGFAGLSTPANPDTQDAAAFPTTLSGDLNADDDLPDGSRGDNSFTVVQARSYDQYAPRGQKVRCEDLVIRSGDSADTPGHPGAGLRADLFNANTTVELVRCTIEDCVSASDGGGVYVAFGSILLDQSVVRSNRAFRGGGAAASNERNEYYEESRIYGDRATFEENEAEFGGALCMNHAYLDLDRCTVSDNSSGADGGGVWMTRAAAVIDDTSLVRNAAGGDGGAILLSDPIGIRSYSLRLLDNSAQGRGGGVATNAGWVDLTSFLIAGNSSGLGASAIHASALTWAELNLGTITGNRSFDPTTSACALRLETSSWVSRVRNCIIHANSFPAHGDSEPFVYSGAATAELIMDHTIIDGGIGGVRSVGELPPLFGPYAFSADPMFQDPLGDDLDAETSADNDYALRPGSPAIDRGRGTSGRDAVEYPGLTGFTRDIGAFEAPIDTPNPCPADLDRDGVNTYSDILAFMTAFAAGRIEADLYRDAAFNALDAIEFLTAFADGCP